MSDTHYLSIVAVQRPTSIPGDSAGRAVYSFNFLGEGCNVALDSTTHIVADWCRDLVEICILAGIGLTLGTDTFIGTAGIADDTSQVPLQVYFIDTGGRGTSRTHNGAQYEQLSAQVYIRAATGESAYARAMEIYTALDGTFALTVSVD